MPEDRKILYIAGYGRSGSTILSIMLDAHPKVRSIGEASLLFDLPSYPGLNCSCGETFHSCSYWGDLLGSTLWAQSDVDVVRRIETLGSLPKLLGNRIQSNSIENYVIAQNKLFEYIYSSSNPAIIVDSSKTARKIAGRPLALYRYVDKEIYVIHLVRSARSTMKSLILKGSNWNIEGISGQPRLLSIRSITGWVLANLWSLFLKVILDPSHYLLIKYEDLLRDPHGTLGRIGEFCDFDITEIVRKIDRREPFEIYHLVGGNRIRRQRQVVFDNTHINSSNEQLSFHHKILFFIFGFWLEKILGY